MEDSSVSARVLSESIGISLRKIETNIAKLKEKCLLGRVGSARGGYWVIIGGK
jgi:ATP-dependent DNA helicase RecG